MTQQISPFIQTNFGWALGESNWNTGADENWLQFSYLHDRNLDGIVSTLPTPVNGSAYFNTNDNKVYYAVNNVFHSSVVPKWFEFVIRSSGAKYIFNGSSLAVKPADPADTAYTDSLRNSLLNTSTDLGASLVGGAVRFISTITALRASLVGISGTVFVTEPGRGGFMVVDPTVTSDNDITTFIAASGVKFRRVEKGSVNLMWAGAKCDGVTDDTVAVQKVVDYCATFSQWPELIIPGKTYLTASVNINRAVDTTSSEWHVRGAGAGSGFHVSSGITMFSSTLTMTNGPVSEWVCWDNLTFSCTSYTLTAKVHSKHFLRQRFNSCYFSNIMYGLTDKYYQSLYFNHCNVRAWPASGFINSDHIFDVKTVGTISEHGAGYFLVCPNGLYSGSFVGGVHEGSTGGLIAGGGIQGLFVAGLYSEFNALPTLDFSAGPANSGIEVSGNFLSANTANSANPAFFDIVWGTTTGGVSNANRQFTGRMHNNSGSIIDSTGDTAAGGDTFLYSNPKNVRNNSGTWVPASPGGAVTVSVAKYTRTGKQVRVEFQITWPTSSVTTAAIITGLPYPVATTGIVGGVVANTTRTGFVQIVGGSAITGGADRIIAVKDLQGTAYTYAEMSGAVMHGSMTYEIA